MSTRILPELQAAPPSLSNRRQFLATTASAAAFSVVGPAILTGADANPLVSVGAVGLGGRGGWIANFVASHGGFRITAAADYFDAVVQSAGDRLQVPKERRFSGLDAYKRLLDSKVDAVFLETPPYFFPVHARAAVAAGCHVYLAKPVAVDVPGCLEILELGRKATANKKVFLVDLQTRTDAFHIEAVQKVRDGMIGQVGLTTSFYHDDCFPDPPPGKTIENLLSKLCWCNHTALSGGYLVAAGIHAVDVALWISGELPRSATGHGSRRRANAQGDTHDCYALSYEFPNGTIMAHTGEHMPDHTGFKAGCIAYGQTGYLEANYAGKVFIRGVDDAWNGGESPRLYTEGMQSNVRTFHKSITEEVFTNPTLVPSVNSTLATILGREAGQQGRMVTWDELLKDTRRLEVDLGGLKV
jgi:myo-inositol 2-dehydrogenase / D-chiro-inositol 1-dehydrogenase